MEVPTQICDMHVHSQYSHDCLTSMHDIKAITRKYDMMVAITDHNRIGGSLAAKAMNIPTIPAIEVTTKKLKDFLVYFHDFDNLVEFYDKTVKPALDPGKIWGSRTKLSEEDLFDALEDYDRFVSLAHPYCPIPKRSANLPNHIMRKVDAIEVVNFTMSPRANQKAALLRDKTGKAHTAGSDSHHPSTLGMTAVRAHEANPTEFLTEIRQSRGVVVSFQRTGRDMWDKLGHYLATKQTA